MAVRFDGRVASDEAEVALKCPSDLGTASGARGNRLLATIRATRRSIARCRVSRDHMAVQANTRRAVVSQTILQFRACDACVRYV